MDVISCLWSLFGNSSRSPGNNSNEGVKFFFAASFGLGWVYGNEFEGYKNGIALAYA